LTVEEMLEMGRCPCKGLFKGLSARERGLVDQVIETLDLGPLRDRTDNTLSGGKGR
jgi:ABC-type cobalamin/Fe3+-siderophores transport system ATPase subunit